MKETKDKCIAIIQKQIDMKIIWWQESYKTSTRIWKDSRGMILVSPNTTQTRGSHRISKPANLFFMVNIFPLSAACVERLFWRMRLIRKCLRNQLSEVRLDQLLRIGTESPNNDNVYEYFFYKLQKRNPNMRIELKYLNFATHWKGKYTIFFSR